MQTNTRRRAPLDNVAQATAPATRTVCHLNGAALGVRVHSNGWAATYDGKDCALADIPSQYHGMIKATVKGLAYDLGYFTYAPPSVPCAGWDRVEWIDHVTFNFPI